METVIKGLIFGFCFFAFQVTIALPLSAATEEDKADEVTDTSKSTNRSSAVKLRVIAVNPSKERPQTVPIKIYLPKEVIPDDIIEMGELKAGYDSEKGLYYAFSDGVKLKPQETRVFEVKLEDVWRMGGEKIQRVREQTQRAVKYLENTEYFGKAKVIADSIDKRLNEIEVKQNDESISREEHIGAYRVNQMIMDRIEKDVNLLEKMLITAGGPPSVEFLKESVFERNKDLDKITAWKIILATIGFMGLLGFGFYLRWFLQIKDKREAG